MHTILPILVVVCCFAIAYQDFKSRLIHVGLLVMLTACITLMRCDNIHLLIADTLINMSFLMILYVTLYLYFLIRRGERQIVNKYIGLGDVLILVCICAAFNLQIYTATMLASCLASLVYYAIHLIVYKKKILKIPLAAFIAITFMFTYIFSLA